MFDFQLVRNKNNYKVKAPLNPDLEPQEVLLDSLAQKKEEEIGVSSQKLEVPLLKRILQGFLVFSGLLIFGLFLKTFQLQVLEGKIFSILAQENKFIVNQIQAERGVIYDRNLEQIVLNLPSFDLIVDKEKLAQGEERERVFCQVADILGRDCLSLAEEVENSSLNQQVLVEDIPHQSLILLEARIKDLPGFKVVNNTIRDYKEGPVFSHLIGYTSKIKAEEWEENPDIYSIGDYVGRTGLENFYEDVLRKNPGKLRIERDALGNVISKEIISLPESGKSLVLWLDKDLQKKVKEVLEGVLNSLGTKEAAAVAIDPQTGGVLALVSLPDFDNNLFQKGADPEALQTLLEDPLDLEPLFNRVISGRYLTGSTIKPLIASAALEENIISPEKSLYCTGSILIRNPWDETSSSTKKDWTSHGWTDMRKAIAESCNVYFYTVGGGYEDQEGLGPTRIKEYLDLFGWEEKSGIDLPGEAAGFVPDKKWKEETFPEDPGWWDGDTYNLAIGQGFLQISPLEVVSSFVAIANGGKLLQPQVVKAIVDEKKEVIEEIEPQIIRQSFIEPEYLEIVREGMRQAVTGYNSPQASAVELNSLPVKVAAKTGTAELGKERYHNWITVFAPYEAPKIVLTLMIEDLKGIQRAAIPAAKSILQWYFSQPESFDAD